MANAHLETDALRHVTERLREEFPDRSGDEINQAVASRYAQFGNSVIRDFIPVLVERSVRDQLAGRPDQQAS